MLRKLSLAVAISGLLSPVGVHALGLGNIQLDSALNQRLNAEISVHLSKSEELEDVKIELASLTAFARAGIERPFILSGLRFTPVLNSEGATVIAVTSRKPIREPFLNFLIEVNWPKGRLVREYTLLLDPPVTLKQHAAQIERPVATQQSTINRAAPTTQPSRSVDNGEGREYGPVVADDTLWQIASKMRIEGESVAQVMMALLYNNPEAFIHNNVNRLKRGAVLRLPTTDEVKSLSNREARAEFAAQTQQWRDQRVRSKPPTREASPVPKTESNSVADQDRLKLASVKKESSERETTKSSGSGQQEYNKLEQELVLVRESNEVIQQEGTELRSRIGELEAQLQDIKRLLTLRNDQLAQMQTGQQAQATTPVANTIEPVETSPAPVTTDEVATETVDEKAAVPSEMQAEPTVTTAPEPVVAAQQPVAVEPAEPVVSKKAEPAPSGSSIDAIQNNSTLMAIAGGVIALLLILVTIVIRRRRSAEAEFAESILVTPKMDTAAQPSSSAGLATESGDETSLLSDFSPSDIDALQDETGEVDPLSEADVYVAYGRYQQAEELIQQAIEKDDHRIELKFKLLEIYYSTQNAAAFTELAQRLSDQSADKNDPQAWAQIISMGYELAPDEPLFSAAGNLVAGDEGDWEQTDLVTDETSDELGDLDNFDLSDLEAELGQDDGEDSLLNIEESAEKKASQEKPESLNLDDTIADESDIELTDLSTDDETLDLGDLDLSSEFSGDDLDDDLAELSNDLDAEVDFSGPDSLDIASELGGESLDLGGLGEELESLSEDLESEDLEINLDEMSSSLEEAAADDTADSLLSESDDLIDGLSDEDEVDTKLDLARAYADMGDKEGAENILQEVISEGTDTQKQAAEELIKSFS